MSSAPWEIESLRTGCPPSWIDPGDRLCRVAGARTGCSDDPTEAYDTPRADLPRSDCPVERPGLTFPDSVSTGSRSRPGVVHMRAAGHFSLRWGTACRPRDRLRPQHRCDRRSSRLIDSSADSRVTTSSRGIRAQLIALAPAVYPRHFPHSFEYSTLGAVRDALRVQRRSTMAGSSGSSPAPVWRRRRGR